MNARAKELGCTDTTFSCVHGLYDYGNVSTAEDLAKIAAACYANETYMQAANTLTYTLPATNLHQNERTIKSPTSCWTRSMPITATMSEA